VETVSSKQSQSYILVYISCFSDNISFDWC